MIAVFAGCSTYLYDPTYPLRQRDFASDDWRQGDQRARGEMVRDLMESDALIGLKRGEIVDLLGEPFTASEDEILDRFHFLTPERGREILGEAGSRASRYLYYSVETGFRRWHYGLSIVLDDSGIARYQFLHD